MGTQHSQTVRLIFKGGGGRGIFYSARLRTKRERFVEESSKLICEEEGRHFGCDENHRYFAGEIEFL